MLVALTGGQKLGLALTAGVFIAFALVSAFVLPKRNPTFPGARGLRWFVIASFLLFAAMMAAVVLFAKEEEEPAHAGEAAETQAGETGETGTEPAEPAGDPAAGKEIFASAGCGSCHTLADAGATGTVGPNLDETKPSFELAVERVTNGMPPMPAFADQLSEEQIRDVSAYVVEASGS